MMHVKEDPVSQRFSRANTKMYSFEKEFEKLLSTKIFA